MLKFRIPSIISLACKGLDPSPATSKALENLYLEFTNTLAGAMCTNSMPKFVSMLQEITASIAEIAAKQILAEQASTAAAICKDWESGFRLPSGRCPNCQEKH